MKNIITPDELDHIYKVCKRYKIINYEINSNGSIDVDGHVRFDGLTLYEIPLNFNIVTGDFNIINSGITTLKGSPKEVGGDFSLGNGRISSLEYSPIKVGGDFKCGYNHLTSLIGSPRIVNGSFNCMGSRLFTLDGLPDIINGQLNITNNLISSLKGSPKKVEKLSFSSNNISTLEYCPFITGEEQCNFLNNNFPDIVNKRLLNLNDNNIINTFVKYQDHYDIWSGENNFNEDGFNELMDEIEDGLL